MRHMRKAVFVGYNALGDTLCTTPALRAFRRSHPDAFIVYLVQNSTFCRVLDGNPDVDLVLYNEVMYANQGLENLGEDWLRSLPFDIREDTRLYHFDLKQAVTHNDHFQQHIAQNFARLIDVQIDSTRPTIVVTDEERRVARAFVDRPYVVFSLHSVTNPEREKGGDRIKDWPAQNWFELAHTIRHTMNWDVIAVGAENNPQYQTELVRNLYGLPVKVVAALIEGAACLVTLENGLAHMAAGLDASTVQIFPDAVPLAWAQHQGMTRWKMLHGDPRQLPAGTVFAAVREIADEGRERR